MSVKERREREKEELRQDILKAARELFIHEGYENVSMRRIAEKIEYSPTTIYLYFRNKEELLHSICEETFSRLVAEFARIASEFPDPVERLRASGRAYIEFGLKHPNQYRATFMVGHHGKTPKESMRFFQGSMGQKCFMQLRANVEECVRTGRFRLLDIDAVSQALWASMHGITSLLIVFPHFPWVDREQMIRQMTDMLTDGLRS